MCAGGGRCNVMHNPMKGPVEISKVRTYCHLHLHFAKVIVKQQLNTEVAINYVFEIFIKHI